MSEKKDNKRKVFNFGESPLVKQTEQTVVGGYVAIEQREEGGGEPARKDQPQAQATASAASPAEQQPSTPTVQTIPAAVVVANGEPTQNINVPIPVSLHQRLKMISVTKRQNMKDLVALAIKEYVERQG